MQIYRFNFFFGMGRVGPHRMNREKSVSISKELMLFGASLFKFHGTIGQFAVTSIFGKTDAFLFLVSNTHTQPRFELSILEN